MSENSKAPEGILCSMTHEWVMENDDTCTIGLTDIGIEQLGEVVSIEFPEVGMEFLKGDVFAAIESVKAAEELYMPIGGKVVEVNIDLINSPEIINEDPYEKGWLIKVVSDTLQDDAAGLLEYEDYIEEVA